MLRLALYAFMLLSLPVLICDIAIPPVPVAMPYVL